ncbi:Putative uncharacterized protein [Moritella viscosa]|uniref:hypothetical protein n=1 Tax=Moritella viscosa TaxID=80854 RepID=UPI0009189B22|nr:hypothetical protein [Moritella viscosa]SGZ07295.1 Putative uncharacterized protein [Moritella viscosa]
MHSISPYLLRCYNKDNGGRTDQRYSTLDRIGQHDLFYLLQAFIEVNTQLYTIVDDEKLVYLFSNMVFDEQTREIYGWFNVGNYGIKTDIINVDTGNVDFKKAQNNAEIIKHYVHFFIPQGFNEAMAFMHSFRGNGVKTIFHTLFSNYFKEMTELTLQMNPLAYNKAMDAWLNGEAKEVRLIKFAGLPDIADQLRELGHHEQELVIKPKRNLSLGKLKDYLTPNSPQLTAVEVLSEFATQIKTVVEIEGKRRTFCIGKKSSNTVCEIELDDTVILNEGVPEFSSMYLWVGEIITEYTVTLYPGINIRRAS